MTLLLTDLRHISRGTKNCLTTIRLHLDCSERSAMDWLLLGACSIGRSERRVGEWMMQARMDATDVEHDSAYVFRLPLVGLQLDALAVSNHFVSLVGWVESDPERFQVPLPGYDPTKMEGAYRCKECRGKKGSEDPRHIIVPEGFYAPPHNAELYEAVRGKKVSIVIGPVHEEA